MTTGIAAFRIALAQAQSFGLSPAPSMIWATHEELAPEAAQGRCERKNECVSRQPGACPGLRQTARAAPLKHGRATSHRSCVALVGAR
jgi:hypothetical protein